MTKYIIINLLLFLCLTITLQLHPEDEKFPAQDRDNFEITKKAVEIIEKVEEKIEGKNENYSLMTQAENSKKDIYNFNTENTNFSPMQNPYLFQGDEMLTKNQAENLVDDVIEKARSYEIDLSGLLGENTRTKRKIQKDLNYTWEFPINYVVQGVDNEMVDTALKFIENETCVRFSKQKAIPSGQPGLKFVKGNGCWSYVGRSEESKFQDVSIGYGCTTVGTVQHETMHALGSTHEQSRADRDQYLTIVEQNVRPSLMYNFVKLNISNAIDYYIKYDYGSEMQY
uniref:Metalloendopeptidase n=1 Tax=Strongyloides papillosus TaxID=174720 RepID=A0A0N5BY55_STREA